MALADLRTLAQLYIIEPYIITALAFDIICAQQRTSQPSTGSQQKSNGEKVS